MKLFWLFIIINIPTFSSWSQQKIENFGLRKTVKQDGFVFQFFVLDEDKCHFQNFDTNKIYYWYKTQKVLTTQGGASGVLLDRSFEAFYENKQLAQKGEFKKGLKHGEWLFWKMDGSIDHVEKWKRGNLVVKSDNKENPKRSEFLKKFVAKRNVKKGENSDNSGRKNKKSNIDE